MIQVFKIVNRMEKCDTYNRFKIILNQVRGHCFKYSYSENFFYNRIVNIWNSLPSEVVEATSVNRFKAGIGHWMSKSAFNTLTLAQLNILLLLLKPLISLKILINPVKIFRFVVSRFKLAH
jgi:hypothetical protein